MITDGERAVTLEREMDYYKLIVAAIERGIAGGRRGPGPQETLADANAAFEQILTSVERCVGQANALYETVSAHNLNPRTRLFTITSPFLVRTLRAFTLRSVASYVAIGLLLSLILAPLGCLFHHYLKTESHPAARRSASLGTATGHEEGGRSDAPTTGERRAV